MILFGYTCRCLIYYLTLFPDIGTILIDGMKLHVSYIRHLTGKYLFIWRRHQIQYRAAKFSDLVNVNIYRFAWRLWPMSMEVFIKPHLLGHGASGFAVSVEVSPIQLPYMTSKWYLRLVLTRTLLCNVSQSMENTLLPRSYHSVSKEL